MSAINLVAVFDGHGGKDISKFLHNAIPKSIMSQSEYPITRERAYRIYDKIQKTIIKKDPKIAKVTGSTCLVVIHYLKKKQEYLNVLNVGDCRCVLCRDNFAIPLTKDHKPKWPEEDYRIKKLGGKIYYDGDDWRIKDLSVSRAFGDTSATPYVSHRPEVFKYKLVDKDKFMIVACDGLWDVLSNQDAVNFVLANAYNETTRVRLNTSGNIARKLAEYALSQGSSDNITAIVLFFK